MSTFPFTITDKAITVFIDNSPRSFPSTHGNYDSIKAAILADDADLIRQLTDVKANITRVTMGRVQIFDTEIMVDDVAVGGRIVDRILEMVRFGSEAFEGYVKFLDNLLDNPSRTAVQELYLFIEECNLPITPDGHFLAYKRVRNDYKDIHTGTFDNSVGQVCSMPRNQVDDQRNNTCSSGLHFCSYNYLPSFGNGDGDKVVVVKINPADVVSIPSDYNNAKGRTWYYEVVGEIEDWANTRITPWFSTEYSDDEDDYDEDDYDDAEDMDIFIDPIAEEVDPRYADESNDSDDGVQEDGDYSVKMSWDDVNDFRKLLDGGWSLTAAANVYGISRRQAARIRDYECWSDDRS